MGPLNNPHPSATVLHLSDYRVPSHRRRAAPAVGAAGFGSWAQAAQARASSRSPVSLQLQPNGAVPQVPASGADDVRFGSVAGKRYRIQYKPDLAADTPWADLPGTLAATGSLCVATGLVADAPAAFYRVRLEAP